jgi:translation initiation factor IF-3
MAIARQLDLDLVEVAPDANPPVCRIMDFSRFKYEANQRAKESRRKTTSTSIKEMKYRPKIGTGDFDTNARQVARFLGDGHKVKITIMFRGREMSHPELGKRILDHVAETVGPTAKVEAAPKLDGRNMIMVLAPDRRAQQAAAKAARATSDPTTGAAGDHSEGAGLQAGTPGDTVGASTDGLTADGLSTDTAGTETTSTQTTDTEPAGTETTEGSQVDVLAAEVAPDGPSEPDEDNVTTNGGVAPDADHPGGRIEATTAASTQEQ